MIPVSVAQLIFLMCTSLVAEFLRQLFPSGVRHCLLITLGNTLRSDDGVGPYLAEQLRGIAGLQIENAGDRPERSVHWVERYRPRTVVFLDVADFGGAPGDLRHIGPGELVNSSLSTHRLPLAALIAWIEQENNVQCYCLGIQAASLQPGETLSTPVSVTADLLIEWFKLQAAAE